MMAMGKAEALIQKEIVVRPARLERATFWFVARRSIQLSYGRAKNDLLLDRIYHAGGCQSTVVAMAIPGQSAPSFSISLSRKGT